MEVRLLGAVDLLVDGEPVRLSAAKLRMLLAMLAIDRSRPLSSDVLADRLWAGEPPASAASVIRTYISQLRRLMPQGAERLARSGEGYVLRLGPDELDLCRFEALVAAAGAPSSPPEESARLLREALSLWRGPALAELADDDRARAVAAGIEAQRWAAIEALADAELELGRHQSLVPDLERAVAESPLREQLVARLMLALYRSGRQAEALAAFQRLRRRLGDELGLDPSPELCHLEAAVLAQDPTLQPPIRPHGNLPIPLTSFVGREDDAADLVVACRAHRLVTVTGPGGCGKTRLAVEVGRSVTDRRDGVWFADLAARREAEEVAAAVLEALDLDQRPGEEPAATVRRYLADRHALLILDNCEQVAPSCGELVAGLLAAAPDVTILATSRVPLAVAGERVSPLAPLALPAPDDAAGAIAASPAARLLADRVSSARGGRAPDEEEWVAIGELCQHLDGLPLAIELVAAQAGALSVADLAESAAVHMAEASAAPVGPAHHRSLAACVRWSVDTVDPDDRLLLERVCLLPGTFSAGPAAALAGAQDEAVVLSGLGRLARQSLLQPVPGTTSRFRVLETIRQVVSAAPADRATVAALDRLVAWAAAWADTVEPALRGPDATRILDELDAERAALSTALEHGLARPDPSDGIRIAASISALWAYRGYLTEGRQWLALAMRLAHLVDPGLRMRLLVAVASHHNAIGDHDAFRRTIGEALELARTEGAGADVLRVLLWSGHAAALQDDHGAARSLYDEALRLARGAADASSTASALAGLGDVAVADGDLDGAAALHLQALAEFRAAGDPHGEGQALLNVGEVDRRAGRPDEAEMRFRSAAAVFVAIADRSCTIASREGLARVAVDGGRLDDAERLYRAAIHGRLELGQERAAQAALGALAGVLADAGRPLEAAAALGAAGIDGGSLVQRLRAELGDRQYFAAWADGRSDRVGSAR